MSSLPAAVTLTSAMLLTAPDAAGARGVEMMRQVAPILPEPARLAGEWLISEAGTTVAVTLSIQPAAGLPGAPANVLDVRSGDLEILELGAARAWRPAPDGIALVAADGATVAFFSADGAGRYTHRSRRGRVVLARAPD